MLLLLQCIRLHAQEACVLHFQPQSAPLLPAHCVLVDHSRKQLLLLVRGTSTWADCLTDIVAHTKSLGTGAHVTDVCQQHIVQPSTCTGPALQQRCV
jgi:hypothetical protein